MLFSFGDLTGQRLAVLCAFHVLNLCMAASADAQPPADDGQLAATAQQAAIAGSMEDAFATAATIADDDNRQRTLGQISILRQVGSLPGGTGQQAIQQRSQSNGSNGARGGLTEADFDQLIDLITGTIDTESWLDTGSGIGTIQPFPSGVFVDAKGTLRKSKSALRGISKTPETIQSNRPSFSRSDSVAKPADNTDAKQSSPMRVVSLNRLERQTQLLTAQGKPLTDAMKNLAGLTEIKLVAYLKESNDIVIAGPGGPWKTDQRGRAICLQNGKPILQLDDLVTCLQNAVHADGKFGCSITPRQQNLAATKTFLATSKLKGKAWRSELRNVLGQQDIEIFGIRPTNHAAYVLVEADYRMKLVGMGLEPSIDQVPSYLERVQLNAAGNPPPLDVARWWFTLDYDRVRQSESSNVFTFSGAGVKVLSETEFINLQGKRTHTGKSVGPTRTFAEDFTTHFEKMADKYPIYRELKNVFDLAMAANLIHDHGLAKQAAWKPAFFAPARTDEATANDGTSFVSTARHSVLRYPFARANVPRQVDSVINDRVIRQRVQSKTRRHTIVGVSGGVSADFGKHLRERSTKQSFHDQDVSIPASPNRDPATWWWDQRSP